jgi:hypothetical protein
MLGIGAGRMHYLLMILVAATCVAAFEAVGSILVVAMFVVPAACARAARASRMAGSVNEANCTSRLPPIPTKLEPVSSAAATVLADWSSTYSEPLRQALVAQRDRYEKVFARLTDAVDLPEGVKRRYFRLGLLGALNGALMWYQPGGDSPATVAKHLVGLFRRKVAVV